MKRPLFIVAVLYVGGILWAAYLPLPGPLLTWLAAGLILALAGLFNTRAQPLLLGLVLLLTGAINLTQRTALLAPEELRAVFSDDAEILSLRGTLSETPGQRVYEHEGEARWRTLAQLDVQAFRRPRDPAGIWRRVVGTVMVSTPGLLPPSFFGGRTVEVEGVLKKPVAPSILGQFDYRTYLQRQGIYFQMQVTAPGDWRLTDGLPAGARPPLADRFAQWAKANLARGLPEEDEALRLLWAMTLGWKTALTGEVAEPFMRSGTMHVFAISGLHIALIAGLLVAVLRVFKMPRGFCGLIVIPMIWAYTGVTGWQASAIRSTIMMSVIIAGWSIHRPSDLLNSLAAAGLIILVWDPQQLFQAGFQLSFFVVLSIGLFTPLLREYEAPLLQPDPFLPDELRSAGQRRLDKAGRWLKASFLTSLAAWLGSIPIVAYYFHLFTPISLLANMVVVPLSSAALAASMASLAVGSWWPWLTELFNHSAWFWMSCMIRASQWAAQMPGGCLHVGTPTVLAFITYYGWLLCWRFGWLTKVRVRRWAFAALAALAFATAIEWQVHRAATRLTILPLNGGEALHFHTPGRDMLVDCGDTNSAGFVLKPYLRTAGINQLDALVLTHGDIRQVGGAEFVRAQFRVRQILTSPVAFRSAAYRQLRENIRQQPGLAQTLERGGRLADWTALHPEVADHFPQADDNALVLSAELHGTRLLLLSDLGKRGQNALLERHPNTNDLRADIVVAGLPTQTEPLAEALLEVIQPRLVIITDSLYPATARASRRLRERLADREFAVLYTSEAGAITLTFQPKKWEAAAVGTNISRALPRP